MGPQYRSIILTNSEQQRQAAEEVHSAGTTLCPCDALRGKTETRAVVRTRLPDRTPLLEPDLFPPRRATLPQVLAEVNSGMWFARKAVTEVVPLEVRGEEGLRSTFGSYGMQSASQLQGGVHHRAAGTGSHGARTAGAALPVHAPQRFPSSLCRPSTLRSATTRTTTRATRTATLIAQW